MTKDVQKFDEIAQHLGLLFAILLRFHEQEVTTETAWLMNMLERRVKCRCCGACE